MVAHLVPLLAAQRFNKYIRILDHEAFEVEDDVESVIPVNPLSRGMLSSGMMEAVNWCLDVSEIPPVYYEADDELYDSNRVDRTKQIMGTIGTALAVERVTAAKARWVRILKASPTLTGFCRSLEGHFSCPAICETVCWAVSSES